MVRLKGRWGTKRGSEGPNSVVKVDVLCLMRVSGAKLKKSEL